MNLTVTQKTVYGKKLIYPVCDGAKALALIAGSTTLNGTTIEQAKKLGHTFTVQHEEVSL